MSGKNPRSGGGIPARPFHCRTKTKCPGRSKGKEAAVHSRPRPRGTSPRWRRSEHAAALQRPGECCCPPTRTTRAEFRARLHPPQIAGECVFVLLRPVGRERTGASESLAWFVQVGFPDGDRGERRSSLPSERVFAALLVADPDGFFNPR